MAKSKLVKANEKIAEKVVDGYKKIENGVVGGYKKIENGVVGGYKKIEDSFVDNFLTKDGETVEDGTYEIKTKVGNVTTWGSTHKVPNNPIAMLTYDEVEGRFISNNGTVKELTGGRGQMSIRQWHEYPNILPRELYSDEVIEGEKFESL